MAAQFGMVGEPAKPALQLTLTARGPLDKESIATWQTGLDVGHDAIIRTFLQLTNKDAQVNAWKLVKK